MRNIVTSFLSAITSAALALLCLPVDPVQAESTEPKLIALTFDDGPNTTTTVEDDS